MVAMEGTVQDLAGLDLAYSPPYGSAKDPLHMAAFAAMNAIDGLVKFVQPGADLSGFDVTLDVRGTEEEAKAPLPSPGGKVIVIPVDDLRPRLAELEEYKDKRIVVSCASGLRAYVAARVLMQKGWSEVFVLSGSYKARALVLAGDVPKAGTKL
jgi:rhodanese-related sulfurtransferase